MCRHYFEVITKHDFPRLKPHWLLNSKGNRMELDGYSEKLLLAFEHQGEQHYREVNHFNRRDENLRRRIDDDETKLKLCHQRGVDLITIPFTVAEKDLPFFIYDEIIKIRPNLNVILRSLLKNIPYAASNELSQLKDIAVKMGGECLSTVYYGVTLNHRFRCHEGHEWEAKPCNIKRGTWCPACKPERISDSKRKYTINDMQRLAENQGGQFLSDFFRSVNAKYKWECSEGHQWEAKPTGIPILST
jgi:hypothetical protein